MSRTMMTLVSRFVALALLTGLTTVHGAGTHAGRAPAPVQAPPRSHRITTRPAMAPHVPGPRFDTSQNWSGYVRTGGGVTDVSGTWTVPTASPSSCPNAYSATWCGIDGWSDGTVEQLGTEQDYVNGQASYYAWWEMYPKGSATIPYPVTEGDTITASVHYNGNDTFTLTMTSSNASWPAGGFSTTQPLKRARRSSAEWIEEAPFFGGIRPLADFNQVTFTDATSTLGGPNGGIPVTMVFQPHGRPGQPADTLAEPVGASSIQWIACH